MLVVSNASPFLVSVAFINSESIELFQFNLPPYTPQETRTCPGYAYRVRYVDDPSVILFQGTVGQSTFDALSGRHVFIVKPCQGIKHYVHSPFVFQVASLGLSLRIEEDEPGQVVDPVPAKDTDVYLDLQVTLEFIASPQPTELGIHYKRSVRCPHCGAKGTAHVEHVHECDRCRGVGTIDVTSSLSPFVKQKKLTTCGKCAGHGSIVDPGYECEYCKGEKLLVVDEAVSLHIPRGTSDKEQFKLDGKGNTAFGTKRDASHVGDLIVNLKRSPHVTFNRSGDDLIYLAELSFTESLIGFNFTIPHPDHTRGNISFVKTNGTSAGEVIVYRGGGIVRSEKSQRKVEEAQCISQEEDVMEGGDASTPPFCDRGDLIILTLIHIARHRSSNGSFTKDREKVPS
jgi:hypothetical protein